MSSQPQNQTGGAQPTTSDGYRLPSTKTLINASKLAISDDKPILLDYWTDSIDKTAIIGVKEGQKIVNPDGTETAGPQEKRLVKSEDQYTSFITKIFKIETDFIVVTENSIYLVDTGIPTKRISGMK
jgi:hypothetical protein